MWQTCEIRGQMYAKNTNDFHGQCHRLSYFKLKIVTIAGTKLKRLNYSISISALASNKFRYIINYHWSKCAVEIFPITDYQKKNANFLLTFHVPKPNWGMVRPLLSTTLETFEAIFCLKLFIILWSLQLLNFTEYKESPVDWFTEFELNSLADVVQLK